MEKTYIDILKPDDWQLHLREGKILSSVLPFTYNNFGSALVMPNLDNPNVKNFISSTGLSPNPKQALTDIARFYSNGIPSVNFGPGDPLLAHTADEHVSRRQLLESYELLMDYLRALQ